MTTFFENIKRFNDMYSLSSLDRPPQDGQVFDFKERLANFKSIIQEEVEEADGILKNYAYNPQDPDAELKFLTDLSDWLGDMIVYCASEARRFGLPTEQILQVIMDSNFSKLGPDGQPIYDERGKVMKGPNYWKPEPKIENLLREIKK
jgi:predicted HAD superfamily Cof-like phosphohydrolase